MEEKESSGIAVDDSQSPPSDAAYNAAAHAQVVVEAESAEALLLQQILVALAELNASMRKMDKSLASMEISLASMVNQGVKVKLR